MEKMYQLLTTPWSEQGKNQAAGAALFFCLAAIGGTVTRSITNSGDPLAGALIDLDP